MHNSNYKLILDSDNTLNQFLERFYIVPKEPENFNYSEQELEILTKYNVNFLNKAYTDTGYIVFRGKKKKTLNIDQIKLIQNSNKSQRTLANEFKVSVATINKVKNNKY